MGLGAFVFLLSPFVSTCPLVFSSGRGKRGRSQLRATARSRATAQSEKHTQEVEAKDKVEAEVEVGVEVEVEVGHLCFCKLRFCYSLFLAFVFQAR